jgi:hypothetical protein
MTVSPSGSRSSGGIVWVEGGATGVPGGDITGGGAGMTGGGPGGSGGGPTKAGVMVGGGGRRIALDKCGVNCR